MSINKLFKYCVLISTVVVSGSWIGLSDAFAKTEIQEENATAMHTPTLEKSDHSESLEQLDGRLVFDYEGVKLFAPAPAVNLDKIEKIKWRNDFVTFKFDKLRDRQLMYAYDLSSLDRKKVGEVIEAVENSVRLKEPEDKQLRIAIGVEYEIKSLINNLDNNLDFQPALFQRAAVPVNWNDKTKELLEMEDLANELGAAVLELNYALSWESYRNFTSVNGWSGSAKEWQSLLNSENIASHAMPVALWPELWSDLPPVDAFVAVNQKLDINGLEGKAILTSKRAWPE